MSLFWKSNFAAVLVMSQPILWFYCSACEAGRSSQFLIETVFSLLLLSSWGKDFYVEGDFVGK